MKLRLHILQDTVTIHRFPAGSPLPEAVCTSRFSSVSRTGEELTIVCDASIRLEAPCSEPGWGIVKVLGPLDFSQTGILAALAAPLAGAKIPIFSISTFDTDYILVKKQNLTRARKALEAAGCTFV